MQQSPAFDSVSVTSVSSVAALLLKQAILAKHFLDSAYGLTSTGFILYQGKAHVIVAVLAEADARRCRDVRFLEQLLRKRERAHFLVLFGNLRPHVHRRFWNL